MARLDEQITALAAMSSAELKEEWERVHRAPAPRIAADLLRLGIAYRLQQRALGGLSRATSGALRKRAGQTRRRDGRRPGTRLVRSWNGRTITVLVEDDGFLWEDRRYRSLSAIAREVGRGLVGTALLRPRRSPVVTKQASNDGTRPAGGLFRCAIYTRKSTEEGLEQEFNSLDAQREACAAYIASQRHEGWAPVKDSYDDGGFSGGNMERPGLKRLLADVAAGKVQVIVLYKIDRLTRSLSDFSRIVDVLEKAGASFVSVTQSFNTTTSMGRLMLNVLLSFAQFEREVTGERIRDKIAASKKKGMWMEAPRRSVTTFAIVNW